MNQLGTIVTCPAPYGAGGLGQHLKQIIESLQSAGSLQTFFAASVLNNDSQGQAVEVKWVAHLSRWTPLRFSRGLHGYLGSVAFDRAACHRITRCDSVISFAGAALRSFLQARKLGASSLQLESAGTHVLHARKMYDLAFRLHPIERDWLHDRMIRRVLTEYNMADVIWVNSELARHTFLEYGVSASKLRRRTLSVDSRFQQRVSAPSDSEAPVVVYVGSICVSKGTPLLIEQFSRTRNRDARLILVGGPGTRSMRRYLDRATAGDKRISVQPGDPLPHLRRAHVFAFPSFADGLGLAPLEALAVGVPIVVSDASGVKEYVRDGQNGFIVPTGDADALHRRLIEIVPSLMHESSPS